jgi:protease-4
LVVRIDSPGGSVGASEEIWREIIRYRQKQSIPVVVSMGNAAASGGYYIAMAGDRIFSNSGTITGSIGVIVQGMGFTPLLEKLGFEERTVKSGDLKDAGSPLREMKSTDRAYFQAVVYDMYRQFFRHVLAARWKQMQDAMKSHPQALDSIVLSEKTKPSTGGLEWDAFTTGTMAAEVGATTETETALRRLADGRILTGDQAKAVGLVDEIGTLGDAAEHAAQLAGLQQGQWSVYDPEPRPDLSWLLGSMAREALQQASREETRIEFR